jgi:cell division septal protein FtsQ
MIKEVDMFNVAVLSDVALQTLTIATPEQWRVAILALCLVLAALILLWVIVAWFFLPDRPRSTS